MVFDEVYSEYYDLLYKNKDYRGEFLYLKSLIEKYSKIKVRNLLELGCGTGKHAEFFLENLDSYAGVDLSHSMIEKCKINLIKHLGKIELVEENVTNLNLNKKFDCIVSLFHVASYQVSNESLDSFFRVASEHLAHGGVFLFDFWNGSAVLTDPPINKMLEVENAKVKVTRFTTPRLNYKDNVVDVDFKVWIEDLKDKSLHRFGEVHHMRYLFMTELNYLATKYGLTLEASLKWMSMDELDQTSWYGLVVLRK